MPATRVVPLFVLPMGLFPLTQEPLRVFEPRYKQMLDDCVLGDSPFGYVAAASPPEELDGWSMPSEYGLLSTADDLTEQGTNLLFTASGETRFRVVEVLPAALPARDFGEIFPTVDDLVAFAGDLLVPATVSPQMHREATSVQFPGLDGVLPGFGVQRPNDWGLGFEIRDGKSPHWTGEHNSAGTYGHFGQSGTFLWVDPDAELALVVLTDRKFGEWAQSVMPALSDEVLREF